MGSLAPIDTLGIATSDRLITAGGLYRRHRLQLDHEAGAATFVQAFVDDETFDNLSSPLGVVVPDRDPLPTLTRALLDAARTTT